MIGLLNKSVVGLGRPVPMGVLILSETKLD